MPFPSFEEIKERKLVRWATAYLAGAWVVLQVTSLLGGTYGWSTGLLRAIPIVLGIGFLVALVLAWYHGERGAQKVSGVEVGILTALFIIGGGVLTLVNSRAEGETSARDASPVNAGAAASITVLDEAERTSVAVLPFKNVGAGEDYFAEGLTDELLGTMARVPGLRVAARTSAFAFEDSDASADSIGRALGVAHLVEGSVRRAADRVRVSAQLVDAETGFREWAETYDRRVEDVFAVQEEIARAVARELRIRVGGDRLAEAGTADATAYENVLRGRAALERREGTTAEWTAEAGRAFEEALARDFSYAAAWAGLAHVRFQEAYNGVAPDEEAAYGAARTAAERALALNPEEGGAHYVLGQVALHHDLDYAEAAEHYEHAIEADPSDARALAMLGWALRPPGREAKALWAAERAVKLDPLSVNVLGNAAGVYHLLGKGDRALELYRAAAALDPDIALIQVNLANVLSALGEHAEAVEHAQRAVALEPELDIAREQLAYTYAAAGRRAEAEQALASIAADAFLTRAQVVWALGDRDEAFAVLERGIEAGKVPVKALRTSRSYDEMRGDPRWDVLVARAEAQAAGD